MFRADLHMHSHFSDGELSPNALIDLACEKGLSALSITDHDLYKAYSDEVFAYAQDKEILLLPGVEFSCFFKETPIHILAYNVEAKKALLDFCEEHTKRRFERFHAILAHLETKGVHIAYEEKQQGNLGRVFLAQKLIEQGYVSSVKEAFNTYLADRHIKGIKSMNFSIEQTVELIKEVGGTAFLAHPHLIKKKRLLSDVLNLNVLDGIEAFYGFFPAHVDREYETIAQERNLLVSGGSDFHGPNVTFAKMGSSWVDEARTKAIFPGRV